ncbi:MAG: long-chain fatty acid--CoA ligase [Proteobacteria bacterium]|nr:long-chain fatty acid--CoA ligase [Pseudomonadota bacterium]
MLDRIWLPSSHPFYLAEQSSSVGDLFLRRVDRDGHRVAYYRRSPERWIGHTWREFYDEAACVANFLLQNGVESGDKMCIMGATRPDWCRADIGGQLVGAVTLGAYPTITTQQLAYILDHSDSVVAFVEGATEVHKIMAIRDSLPRLRSVCVWDTDGLDKELAAHEWLVDVAELAGHPASRDEINQRVQSIDPASTAIIVYTSGTTGPPKGAMISHKNILAALTAYQSIVSVDQDDVTFSFLPMAHAAERMAGFYARINGGVTTSFATSIPKVLEELREVKPHFFGSVPRIFEKAYGRIMSQVHTAPPSKQRLFRWAEKVGRDVVRRWQRNQPIPLATRVQYQLADRLIFKKIRQIFGGRVRWFITGAAPIAEEILEFFWAAGFPIFEVYGMTEATAITHYNRPGRVRLGSVGHALSCLEERIGDDGEVLVRGPVVFQGYYKDPEATAATIDQDGWLHTGDIGEIDRAGYLYIRDRKKHVIITAGGKNLSPANIENEIRAADSLISQAHAHGDKRPYLTALVTIGASEAVEYARDRGLINPGEADRILSALAQNPLARPDGLSEVIRSVIGDSELRTRIVAAVRRANQQLARVETIKKIHLLDREFSIEENEMTPTFKVKRKAVEQKFADIFDQLYSDESFGLVI